MKRWIKKCIFAVTVGFLAVSVVLLLVGSWTTRKWVMKVNGEPVWEEEFLLLARGGEGISSEMKKELPKADWLNYVVRYKVVQAWGRELDPSAISDYYDILQEMENTNENNRQALEASEAVYGLRSYDIDRYYSHRFYTLRLEVRNSLLSAISEDEILGFYEANKEERYKNPDQKIFWAVGAGEGGQGEQELAEIHLWTSEQVLGKRREEAGLTLELLELNKETVREFIRLDEDFTALLGSLEAGEWSFVMGSGESARRIYCVSCQEDGWMSLESVKSGIRDTLAEEYFNKAVELRAEGADVELNEPLWKEISLTGK